MLQSFSLISALCTVGVALTLALLVRRNLDDAVVQEARNAIVHVRAVYNGAISDIALNHAIAPDERASLDHLSDSLLAANQVVALTIYTADGKLWYWNIRGTPPKLQPPGITAALRGNQSDLLIRGSRVDGKDLTLPPGRILQSYGAVLGSAPGRQKGAIEIDASLAAEDAQVSGTIHTVWVGLAAGFGVLYLVFFLLVRRVSGALVKQSAENSRLAAVADARARDARMLNAIGQRLNGEEQIPKVVGQILRSASEAMGFANTALLLMEEDDHLHAVAATGSLATLANEGRRIGLGVGIIGRAALVGRTIYIVDVRQDADYVQWAAETRSEIALPLKLGDDVIGMLNVERPDRDAFSARDRQNLAALADMAAGALQNARLMAEREQNRLTLLTTMANNLDARDRYTAGHSRRVTNYATTIARAMKYDDEALTLLERAGQMHDIGKIGVPDAILLKPDRLNEAERVIMEKHPVTGCEILKDERFLWPALPLIRHHHERWDGLGYPDGLAGNEIPLGARVLAVADTFDAMTSDRPYRRGLSLERAQDAILAGSGTQFDPEVARVMLHVLGDRSLVIERDAGSLVATS
jgi:HD-GYP domain-containing protein (c-di-GMP phosphodiesterase class II)